MLYVFVVPFTFLNKNSTFKVGYIRKKKKDIEDFLHLFFFFIFIHLILQYYSILLS